MIGYVTLGSDNMPRARAFYDELLGSTIGSKRIMEFGDDMGGFTMWGSGFDKPGLAVTNPYNQQPAVAGNGNMAAIAAGSRANVDKLHAKVADEELDILKGAGVGRHVRRPSGRSRRGRAGCLLRRLFSRSGRQQARRLLHRTGGLIPLAPPCPRESGDGEER